MYRLTVDGVETYMVVTRNVFSHRLTVHRKYDLKVGPVERLVCVRTVPDSGLAATHSQQLTLQIYPDETPLVGIKHEPYKRMRSGEA